jgi:hypothetical protein
MKTLNASLSRLDDDPGDKEGYPGDLCEAFQEHELIRNAYIDAFIQKVVYGATH